MPQFSHQEKMRQSADHKEGTDNCDTIPRLEICSLSPWRNVPVVLHHRNQLTPPRSHPRTPSHQIRMSELMSQVAPILQQLRNAIQTHGVTKINKYLIWG